MNQRFLGICTSIFRVEDQPIKKKHSSQQPAARWFLARSIFDPEDGSDVSLRIVSFTDYTALYPRMSTYGTLRYT
jgi:hypothetical protein